MILSQSAELDQLATDLCGAQSQIQGAIKDRQNPAFRSTYADLSSVWDACRAPLTSHGLSVTQHPGRLEDGSVSLTTILLHKSGQHISSVCSAVPKDQSPAAVGSILTYLRRYALASVAGVAPEDDDGQAASSPAPSSPARQAAPMSQEETAFRRTVDKVAQTFNGTVESIERLPPRATGIDPSCPTCGSTMWDNRPKKQSGEMNPKAPDFKCKDKSCQGVIWKHKEEARGPAPQTRGPLLEQAPPPSDDDMPF